MILENPVIDELRPKGKTKEDQFKSELIQDLWICLVSREASILGRREVLTGKAKFGILGDGKELAQIAMAKVFKKGDFRSGYYRDQTLMFALGISTIEQFFAQLYADTEHDPFSGGRQMNCHFASPFIDKNGEWLDLTTRYNISADLSSTGGQMGRALGLAMGSKLFRTNSEFDSASTFSIDGNEVCFCTIGDASTSEGAFWETLNAAAVTKVPLVVCVWDDGYGISVPIEYQTTKKSISKAIKGFLIDENGDGIYIYTVKGWDYPALCASFERAVSKSRKNHIPVLIHVQEVTQPQGHSTSGSHERYKTKARLAWEKEADCIERMAGWMIDNEIIDQNNFMHMRQKATEYVREGKNRAWARYCNQTNSLTKKLQHIYNALDSAKLMNPYITELLNELKGFVNPHFSEVVQNGRKLSVELWKSNSAEKKELDAFMNEMYETIIQRYSTHLHSETKNSALKIPVIEAEYSDESPTVNGYQVLNRYFDIILEKNEKVIAFGEDVGQIGDVNQGFAGLQKKYGDHRVFDTGIREWTIIGQAIGLAMRGFRPIAEIQYLDYLVYGLSPLTDDLATLRYRSNGIQMAPAIIRTRGHRLEGIWHAGSPLGMLINSLRGIYILTPRNMVQAAGLYNTIMNSDDPALMIECLNGYRLKERMPDNLGEFTVPLGAPEVLSFGEDITLVTYGSCVRVAQEAITKCQNFGISVELIDVQTLLPFDLEHKIVESLKKTNRVLFLDEDVPGGATAFMMQKVLEEQEGYNYLDSAPQTITSSNHRPPYGTDGDYFSKPNAEDVFKRLANIMIEAEPSRF